MMKKNKRAQFFSMYLVVLTLFMCGLSVYIYNTQYEQMANFIVSPIPLLELQDELEIFEIKEAALVKEIGCVDNFKEQFIAGLKPEMKKFLLKGFDREFGSEDIAVLESFYSYVDGKLKRVARKDMRMPKLYQDNKNSFSVELQWEYGKEYVISC